MQIARKLLPLLVFTVSLGAHASKKKLVVPPDVLARIHAAHTIFVSNAGEDAFISYYRGAVGAGHNEMYEALAGWPGVQLVDSPGCDEILWGRERGQE